MKRSLRASISSIGHRVQNSKTRFFNPVTKLISNDIRATLPVMNISTSRLVVCAMVRDEDDILQAWLDHLASHSAQLFVVDHKSNVNSSEKLRKYVESHGGIYARLNIDGYYQQETMSFLLKLAVKHLPDEAILLPLDADEFVSRKTASALTKALMQDAFSCSALRWRNAYPLDLEQKTTDLLHNSMTLRVADKVAPIWKSATTVAMARRWRLRWAQGNHLAYRFTGSWVNPRFNDEIEILHVPIRSPQQLKRKLDKGIAEYEARNKNDGNGFHWKEIRDGLGNKENEWHVIVANYGQPINSDFALTVNFADVALESFINDFA